jgi:hypothetical protein
MICRKNTFSTGTFVKKNSGIYIYLTLYDKNEILIFFSYYTTNYLLLLLSHAINKE